MNNVVDFCSLCFSYNNNIQNAVSLDSDGKVIQEKLTDFFPETINIDAEILLHICGDCLENINNTIKFKQKCLDNINILHEYVQKLKADNCTKSLQLSDILNYKLDRSKSDKNVEEMPIKDELNEEFIIKDENMHESFVDCNVVIKTEPENSCELIQEDIPRKAEARGAALNPVSNIVPTKSKEVYEIHYSQFMDWRQAKNANSFSENIILAYFGEISSRMKSSTLWKIYSMLRCTISVKHNIDIANYAKLRTFLKRQADGYQAKKSKTLTSDEIKKFIDEAPDHIYLATKVFSIIGILGACRKSELWKMKIDHIEDLGTAVSVRVLDTKTKVERKFKIAGYFYTIFKKYLALRPPYAGTNHLFLNYQKGRCTKQVIGINKFGNIAKQIAGFLQLKNPELYTGNCFRRTSATILIDTVTDLADEDPLK